jgi:Uncharacterized protein containing a NRPS condensation (elongation) domain
MPVKTTLTPSAKKLELLEALLIEEGLHEAGVRVPVQEDRSRFVTSFMQQRLWFLDQMEPGAATYNVYSAVRLEGHLDLALLERSLNAVVQRHETLRTRFDLAINGQPEQIVLPTLRIHLHVVQVPNENGKSRGDIIAELIRAEASKPFDLKNGPLFRTQLLQVNPLEHVALFTMHHMICDGWSQGVLVNDLTAFYAAYAQGRDRSCRHCNFSMEITRSGSVRDCKKKCWRRNSITGVKSWRTSVVCWKCPQIAPGPQCKRTAVRTMT